MAKSKVYKQTCKVGYSVNSKLFAYSVTADLDAAD